MSFNSRRNIMLTLPRIQTDGESLEMTTCPHCNKVLDYPEAETMKFCPVCGGLLSAESSVSKEISKTCPVCCTKIEDTDEYLQCPDCGMTYHKECWYDNKGCATYGCKSAQCLEPPPLKIDPNEKVAEPTETQDYIICPQCSMHHAKDVSFCWSCGYTFETKQKKTISSAAKKHNRPKESKSSFWSEFFGGIFTVIVYVIIRLIIKEVSK